MRSKDPNDRLVEQALRCRWDVPQELRGPLIERLNSIAMSGDEAIGTRERISAVKALLACAKITLDAIRVSIVANEHDQVLEDLDELERARADEDDAID
jgi:hypothetical protein